MRRALHGPALACALLACASELPARYVIERDLGAFRYRRYQKTIAAELEVPDNPAEGHTATYLLREGANVALATAFVSVYERPASLAAEVREQLQQLDRYKLSVRELEGGYVFVLEAAPDEHWAIWVSGRHVIKLGAPRGQAIPEALAAAYMDAYPSDLDEHGRAHPDAASRGRSVRERAEAQEQEEELPLPRYLR